MGTAKKKTAAKAAPAPAASAETKRLTVVGDATGPGHTKPEHAPEIDDDAEEGDE